MLKLVATLALVPSHHASIAEAALALNALLLASVRGLCREHGTATVGPWTIDHLTQRIQRAASQKKNASHACHIPGIRLKPRRPTCDRKRPSLQPSRAPVMDQRRMKRAACIINPFPSPPAHRGNRQARDSPLENMQWGTWNGRPVSPENISISARYNVMLACRYAFQHILQH